MTYDLQLIIDKIKRDKGLDLSGYKESTLRRRIERRLEFDDAASIEEYVQMIDRDHHLYWRLVSDFFIGVTDFFRDKEVWNIVSENVLPEIVERKTKDERRETNSSIVHHPSSIGTYSSILRIWCAGCSTGEETYSMAIAVKEALRKEDIKDLPVFIYGTDIMEDRLEIAKEGIYAEEKLKDIDENIKFRYFEPLRHCEGAPQGRLKQSQKEIASFTSFARNDTAKRYTLDADTKRLARFRKYDLVRPETLAGFDMIVCRNVLIYFQRHLQEKVLKNFHRALRENGRLWLGTAESLSEEAQKLFKPICKNEKIFRKM